MFPLQHLIHWSKSPEDSHEQDVWTKTMTLRAGRQATQSGKTTMFEGAPLRPILSINFEMMKSNI